MANIVELQENGVSQYLKTHAKAVDGLKEAIVDIVYPVGSFYMSEVSIDPSEILGIGVWQRVKGKFLLGVDEGDSDISKSGLVGGEKNHALTAEENGPHTHSYTSTANNNYVRVEPSTTYGTRATATASTGSSGDGKPHNNMPPYYTAFIWRRTA